MKIEIGGIYYIKDIKGYYSGLNGNLCVVDDIKDTVVKIIMWDNSNTYWIHKMYLEKYSLSHYRMENDNLSNPLDFYNECLDEMDHTVAERASNDNMLRQNCSSQN